ncbi:MAG: transposase [Candidatus Marinimicrobia bacterium]|nr:transposase [Candidatus Neomarinimicrobiota bacterium]MCH7762577.1 transposase [Candidatus Neomarinimicrobiota bacterium]
MTSLTVHQLLDHLKVKKSLNRPRVSNDNPYSESQFKTLKYRPEFPERFGSIQDARNYCGDFFKWYNEDHYHSGLNYLSPHSVHYGKADHLINQRQKIMNEVFKQYPGRFKNGIPKISGIPGKVWINKPEKIND